jgi:hypothetical protein
MIPTPAYTAIESKLVYQSMFLVGRQALKSGYDAILDATFLREDYRSEAVRKLGRYSTSTRIICVLCDAEVARKRNSERSASVPSASFDRLSASFQKPKDAIFVHSDKRTAESAAKYLLRRLGRKNGSDQKDGGGLARRGVSRRAGSQP